MILILPIHRDYLNASNPLVAFVNNIHSRGINTLAYLTVAYKDNFDSYAMDVLDVIAAELDFLVEDNNLNKFNLDKCYDTLASDTFLLFIESFYDRHLELYVPHLKNIELIDFEPIYQDRKSSLILDIKNHVRLY